RGFNLQGERQKGRAIEEEEGKGKGVATTTSTPSTPIAPGGKSKGKGKNGGSERVGGQMMFAFIAVERCIGRGSTHNFSPTQVLKRSRRLSERQDDPRLGDDKVVAMESVGSLIL
ncbi:UNVERIFIED_CONTAM: hypothetical protein Sindi_0100300, partial [Sesamum indicum]